MFWAEWEIRIRVKLKKLQKTMVKAVDPKNLIMKNQTEPLPIKNQ
jgi:hypothetical protein